LHIVGESSTHTGRPKRANKRNVAALFRGQLGSLYSPDAVVLEAPEWLLGVMRSSRRAEFSQQDREIFLGFEKRDFALTVLPFT
jgi:hypothetical protein